MATVHADEIAGAQFDVSAHYRRKKHRQQQRARAKRPRCVYCGRVRSQHRKFLTLWWCDRSLRGVDDATPIYLLTFRSAGA